MGKYTLRCTKYNNGKYSFEIKAGTERAFERGDEEIKRILEIVENFLCGESRCLQKLMVGSC